MEIPKELSPTIKTIQKTLFRIQNKERFFFNITQYQEMGLVYGKNEYYTNAAGNKERLKTHWYLTDKAKQILNVIV